MSLGVDPESLSRESRVERFPETALNPSYPSYRERGGDVMSDDEQALVASEDTPPMQGGSPSWKARGWRKCCAVPIEQSPFADAMMPGGGN